MILYDGDQKASILNNLGCFKVAIGENEIEALSRFMQSLTILNNSDDPLSLAITYNNKSVIEIKNSNFKEAFKSSKAAITIVEPFIFEKIKTRSEEDLKKDENFQEKLQILLIAYKNFSVIQNKINNFSYAKTVKNHLQKMANKLLNKSSRLSESFEKIINKNRREIRNTELKSEKTLRKKQRPFTSHSNATSTFYLLL